MRSVLYTRYTMQGDGSPQASACKAAGAHADLPVRTAGGVAHCFNCIVEEHQTHVFNLALGFMHDRAIAEDATQEALVSAYRAFGRFRDGALRSWLLRIAANVCRDMLRAAKVRPAASLEALPLLPEDPASEADSPETQAERLELASLVQRMLALLPEDQRMAIQLVGIQDLSYEEAAEALGCNLGTLKSRLARGRVALRGRLLEHRELLSATFRLER